MQSRMQERHKNRREQFPGQRFNNGFTLYLNHLYAYNRPIRGRREF